jgi:effector-binding domain-containing protein
LYYDWNEEDSSADLAAAIPVSPDMEVDDLGDFERIEVPAGKALPIEYYGAYEQIGGAHEAMHKYMSEGGIEIGTPVIEEYVTDPEREPDTSKWLNNIYYPLK